MTRRHDERWAIPTGKDEHVLRLQDEVLRLNQVQRTLEANIDFLRSERDRLRDAVEEWRRKNNDLLSNEEAEIAKWKERAEDEAVEVERLLLVLNRIADPEEFDGNWKAMRKLARNAVRTDPS